MAKIKFILNSRATKEGANLVMLSFTHRGFRKHASLGVNVDSKYWDVEAEIVSGKHPNYRQVNQRLQFYHSAAEGVLLRHYGLDSDGETIFAAIEEALFPEKAEKRAKEEARKAAEKAAANTLLAVARRFADLKKPSTRLTYERTLKHLTAFCARGHSDNLNEMNRAWLTAFDNNLAESNPSANARALHFRNLRAIINYAIDEEITTNYPFRRFKIKTVKTDKRSLSVETLRQVLSYDIEDWQELYRDMFALSFMLMGINFADLLKLDTPTSTSTSTERR